MSNAAIIPGHYASSLGVWTATDDTTATFGHAVCVGGFVLGVFTTPAAAERYLAECLANAQADAVQSAAYTAAAKAAWTDADAAEAARAVERFMDSPCDLG